MVLMFHGRSRCLVRILVRCPFRGWATVQWVRALPVADLRAGDPHSISKPNFSV